MEKIVHLLITYTMLVLTLLLFHKGRKHPRSLMLALYASVEVLTNGMISLNYYAGTDFYVHFPFSHFIYKPLYCLWVPLFYLYFRHCLSSSFRFNKTHLIHFVPFVLFLVFFLSVWIGKGNAYILENLYGKNAFISKMAHAVDITVKIQYLVYISFMIRSLLLFEKAHNDDNAPQTKLAVDIRWLRFIVYGYAVGCLGGIVVFVSVQITHPFASTLNLINISYFLLFFIAIFYNTITHKFSDNELRNKPASIPLNELSALMKKIEAQITNEKMYLVTDLTLPQIAHSLNEKERNISQAINTVKKRNVNDYINSLRVEHACRLLLENKDKPIFEVMFESGFSTKAGFNLSFKKITGKTPTQYREENK
jgi:AraC-like DNA-binding protein